MYDRELGYARDSGGGGGGGGFIDLSGGIEFSHRTGSTELKKFWSTCLRAGGI